MAVIKCCKDCVPPKRHVGCHDECEQYLAEKAEYEKEKEYIKQNKSIVIRHYDFDKNMLKVKKYKKNIKKGLQT